MVSLLIILIVVVSVNGGVNFVAGGTDTGSASRTMAYSVDGVSWNTVSPSPFTSKCNGIAYSATQKKWLALGQGGNTLAISLDGMTWTGLGSSLFPSQGNKAYYSPDNAIWAATGYGAAGANLAFSPDGLTWTYVANSHYSSAAFDVVYAPAVGRWVSVGSGGNAIAYSTDRITWTGLGVNFFGGGGNGYAIAYSTVVNQFVAVGIGSTQPFGYSLDGVNWVGHNSVFPSAVANGVGYGQGKWIITGASITTPTPFANSTDVTSGVWTRCPNQTAVTSATRIVYDYGYNRWIATGWGSSMLAYSFDGNNWVGVGNLFGTSGQAVTSNTIVPPVSQLSTSLNGMIVSNSTSIAQNTTTSLNGNLTVVGDLYVLGTLNVSTIGKLGVNGTLLVAGSTTFQTTAILNTTSNTTSASNYTLSTLDCQSLNLNDAIVEIVLDVPPSGSMIVLSLMKYRDLISSSAGTKITTTYPEPRCIDSTTDYSGGTMTVTLNLGSCPTSPPSTAVIGNPGSPMLIPIWAIVIIAVAGAGIGVAIVLVIMVLTKRSVRLRTENQKDILRQQSIEHLQRASETLNNGRDDAT